MRTAVIEGATSAFAAGLLVTSTSTEPSESTSASAGPRCFGTTISSPGAIATTEPVSCEAPSRNFHAAGPSPRWNPLRDRATTTPPRSPRAVLSGVRTESPIALETQIAAVGRARLHAITTATIERATIHRVYRAGCSTQLAFNGRDASIQRHASAPAAET